MLSFFQNNIACRNLHMCMNFLASTSAYIAKFKYFLLLHFCCLYTQIGIWEERKVFGSRGQILKEELVGKQVESNNRNGKHIGTKMVSWIFYADCIHHWWLCYIAIVFLPITSIVFLLQTEAAYWKYNRQDSC